MVQLKNKLPCILAAITLVLTAAEAASASVRGVAPEKYELYKASSDGTWTCLDGSKIISHSAINDDYCDCVDGSDEPGTSACPNGLFYCANVGHIPSTIKSYAVNDGVCDEACCDGSDENGGLITCPDRCKAVGEAYRRDQSSLQQSTLAGLAAKEKLIEEAENQVTLWEEQQIKLEDEIILKKSNVLRLQRELKALEAARTTKKKTKCQSNVLEIDTLKHDITILLKELESLKSILGDMKRDHNHNFHDMAVKSAIAGYDDFMNRYEGIKESINDDVANINVQEPEEQEEEEEEEPTIEEETIDSKEEGKHSFAMTIVEKLESILPDVLKKSLLDKLVPIVKNDNKKAIPHSGISNEADVENARKLYEAADSEVDQLTAELQKIKDDLAIDYGTQREWLKLKDVCVEKDEGE
ncbi:glucosidase II beta subunit-like-domain-containing protein [Mucor mucedo]|uniref:glucosidase II beta subunit-like-domain-containing protein n=1 Tax=Mucor mucedo TaxID=29922 RepID=UPI00221F9009|nr:glucosidase II beta subunit-like-domain-containing protein [Mucor mucedo]KAI7895203.1 glucosidase II beta subunit-like-domain-containing protein [Mucor mucedo]